MTLYKFKHVARVNHSYDISYRKNTDISVPKFRKQLGLYIYCY